MCFNNINIPQNAQINNAYIQFQVDEISSIETNLVIHGDASAIPVTFAGSSFNISERPKTSNSADWRVEPWVFKGERGEAQKSSNIANVVQELIDSNSWVPGNSLAFVVSGSGKRVAESFNGSAEGAPTLIIEYGDFDSTITPVGNDSGEEDDIIDNTSPAVDNTLTTTAAIIAGSDDAEERADGYVSRSSSDLELVQDSSTQTIGLRFNQLNVPKNAVITKAYIQFTADKVHNVDTNLVISSEDTAHSSAFTSATFNISDRPLNSASVDWAPAPWYAVGDAEVAQQTPNIAEVIQPVVTNADWQQGNAVTLVITGQGKRVAASFNGNPDLAPKLVVEYTPVETESVTEIIATVSQSIDDLEENSLGNTSKSSSDLELITDGGEQQVVGIRFSQVNLPQDAEIVDARIQFQADETDEVYTTLTISAELTDDAMQYQSGLYNISNREQTNAQVLWEVNSWNTALEAGASQRTPNLVDVINEIQSMPNWQSGNAMMFIIQGQGKRVATSYDNNPAAAPKLIIQYK